MAVRPDNRSRDRHLLEAGWYDELLATVGPYEVVQQPAQRFVWFLIDTRRPRTRENRHRVEWNNFDGWVVDGEQPGAFFYGSTQMLQAINSWASLRP